MSRIEVTPAAVETSSGCARSTADRHPPVGRLLRGIRRDVPAERDELPPGAGDIELGDVVAGVPFLIDAELYRALGKPDFLLDVVPGREDTFSLEGPKASTSLIPTPKRGKAIHDGDDEGSGVRGP